MSPARGTSTAADNAGSTDVSEVSTQGPSPALPSCYVGWLCAGSSQARLLVDYQGSSAGPQEARAAIKLEREEISRAVDSRQGVLMQFEAGRFDRPIVLGLIQAQPSLVQELLGAPAVDAAPAGAVLSGPRPAEARVDGRRVVLEGADEVVLKCGEASITLKKDGKLILKGAYIETRSKGLNRIKGASVKIN